VKFLHVVVELRHLARVPDLVFEGCPGIGELPEDDIGLQFGTAENGIVIVVFVIYNDHIAQQTLHGSQGVQFTFETPQTVLVKGFGELAEHVSGNG